MFKKKNAVGIYFGSNGVSIVEASAKGKAKNHIFSLYPRDLTKPSSASVPQDSIFNVFLDNEEEIVAFLSRSMRESRIDIDNSEIVISVPSKDLIVRFFEIPPIPRKELNNSIGFEIKKYIPFKIEDIAYDYQTQTQKNIIEVLFAGIKKDDLDKYKKILDLLKIEASAIEPSQFSLLRLLKISKVITSKESVVVVELEKDEGAISIIDNAAPCFSRDVKIASGAESGGADIETLSFRLVNEIRVSIDYFRRQFLKKGIDKIIVLSKDESKELIANFNKELGLPVTYRNPDDVFGAKEEYSLSLAKALGAAFRVDKPSSLVINLSKKQKAEAGSGVLISPQEMIRDAFQEIADIPKATIIKVVALALVVLAGIFSWGIYKINPVQQNLAKITQETNTQLTGDLAGLDKERLASLKSKIDNDLNVYKNVFKKDFLISEKLSILPELMPEGVWFENISYDKANKVILLRGVAYKPSEKEASDLPYAFVSNLKNSPLFSNNVVSISVTSLRSSYVREYKVNQFDIDVRLKN